MVNMRLVDLKINVDGLLISEGTSVDDFISKIEDLTDSNYNITYEILYEEEVND